MRPAGPAPAPYVTWLTLRLSQPGGAIRKGRRAPNGRSAVPARAETGRSPLELAGFRR